MARIILVDGPDNAGKTTMIKNICDIGDNYVELKFPKRTVAGRFDIKSRNEVTCFETMLDYLSPKKVYVLDRGYISNWVYGHYRCEEQTSTYKDDFVRLKNNHNVLPIILSRNEITEGFEDDLISLSQSDFNLIIELFEQFAKEHNIKPVQVLNHYGNNNIKSINAGEQEKLISDVIKWAK
jgi:hypothetical protein